MTMTARPWTRYTYTAVLLLGLWAVPSSGHSNGQNIDGACSSLAPQHYPPPQITAPPYQITFTPAQYNSSTPITVNISSCSPTDGFKGFMIQARRAGSNSTDMIGNFSVVAGTNPACSGSALVHNNDIVKQSMLLQWNPPPTPVGDLVFRVTFVKDYNTFWVNLQSEVLQDANLTTHIQLNESDITPACSQSNVTQPPVTTTLTPVPSGTFPKPIGCGQSMGCFSSCSDTQCNYIIAWEQGGFNNSDAIINITAAVAFASGSYLALGFSYDSEMGDDSVMGCAFGSNSSTIVKFTGYTTGTVAPSMFNDSEVKLTSSMYVDGILSCYFQRPIAGKDKRYDLTKSWTLLFVRGRASVDKNVAYIQDHNQDRHISEQQVSIDSWVDLGKVEEESALIKAHGSLMVGAWVFFASVGIVAARYYKPVWKYSLCSQKAWFLIHRFSMVIVFCATAAAFVIIFVKEKEWSYIDVEGKKFLEGHPIMGVIVMALTLINPIMAFFRPHPGTAKRPIFNWAHWFVGTAAHILGIITIFFGVQLPDADCPYYVVYILAAYVAWQIFVELLLEFISCIGRKKDRSDVYELNSGSEPKMEPTVESRWVIITKRVIFVLHVLIVAALTAAVIAIISLGKKNLED
ncbi:putative ferric-chelate reductase 1 [Physella acuta]|uniref:putative ferric-chelate reductase 1 n=1 Tax=Physella acuta TaxID=109671 RepID=UPI0027DDD7F1|nr:putative ferric-chelate reductase 1 [Physella acuta]